MTGVELLALLTGTMLSLGYLELRSHQSALKRIPTRFHVSGTRGKSSVTRLLAAGLNGAGRLAAAKTTGTLARMILPDGRELPVYRPAGANIIEQKRIVKTSVELGVEALILECMALQPILHWVSENKLIRATHGIITNARADHLDVMGPEEADVAKALAGMIPVGGTLYTAERKHFAILEEAAKDRGTRMVGLDEAEIESVTDEELSGFAYKEHRENVALVLKILKDFGIERERAIKGMWNAAPDPGALSEHLLDYFGRKIIFVNGFAANDPESTEKIWRYAVGKYHDVERVIGVFNLRADRASRTVQLVKERDYWQSAYRTVLIGTGAYLFARLANQTSYDPEKLVLADFDRVDEIFETILERCAKKTLVIGMGNIGGVGIGLVRFFKNRSTNSEF